MRVCVLSDEVIEEFDPSPYLKDFEWEMVTMKHPVADTIRALAARTVEAYIHAMVGLSRHYHRSPDLLTAQQVQDYMPTPMTRKPSCKVSASTR